MDQNDYGYQPEKNIFLAMYDTDLLTYGGQKPTVSGACVLDKIEYPNKTKASLYTPSNAYLLYKIGLIGKSDFTIDFWMRYQGSWSGLSTRDSVLPAFGVYIGMRVITGDGLGHDVGQMEIGTQNTRPQQWAHYAIVRQGRMYYRFLNGKLIVSATSRLVDNHVGERIILNDMFIDSQNGASPCHYKAIRVSKIARWTTDFTPPVPVLKRDNRLYLKNNAVYGIQ